MNVSLSECFKSLNQNEQYYDYSSNTKLLQFILLNASIN